VLTFARPHRFTQEERHILEMFARQCAAALENARMTLDLRKAYERQQELDRLKDQFIITTSHELRTPLTAVQGYIELLGDLGSDVPAELRDEFIATARHNCEELTLMVNTIMDVGRIEVDVKQILLREMELAKVVTQSMELLAAQIRREERILEMVLPAQVSVLVDELRLRQVLVNLVGNALKYSPMGSPLLIQAQETEAEVLVRVRDQGLGVPPEQQPHIFDRFVRLERDLNSPVRGTGLGLFISKQLVEAMGGRLWVESSGLPGEGSTFCFTLQRPRANVQQHEQIQEELRA
jgi:signal transduction histidine kinase